MIQGRTCVALIPARGGSKGVPRKNIKYLAGKPLINYTIEAAKQSRYIDRVFVSTDDLEIFKVSLLAGAEVPFIRPIEFAQDSTSMGPVMRHALGYFEDTLHLSIDYFAVLYPCCPFREAHHIDKALEQLHANESADAVVSVTKARNHPSWCLKKGETGLLKPFNDTVKGWQRRQELEPAMALSGAVTIYRRQRMNYESFVKTKTTGYELDQVAAIDIDEPFDFLLAQTVVEKGLFCPAEQQDLAGVN